MTPGFQLLIVGVLHLAVAVSLALHRRKRSVRTPVLAATGHAVAGAVELTALLYAMGVLPPGPRLGEYLEGALGSHAAAQYGAVMVLALAQLLVGAVVITAIAAVLVDALLTLTRRSAARWAAAGVLLVLGGAAVYAALMLYMALWP